MKKRVLALLLAAALVVGVMPAAMAATEYADVTGRWSQRYIEDMTARGLYQGYNDGLFHPEDPLTTGQAISICVRMCAFEDDMYKAAADDLYGEVYSAVGGSQSWFHNDFAVAVAAGIVTLDELESLYADGKLAGALTREEFGEYLVRAMQIDRPNTAPAMAFGDIDDIGDAYVVPVYLLSKMGIVVGEYDADGVLNFNPKRTIKREDSATMFSRAVKYIDDNQLLLELYDYADYEVLAGKIESFEDGKLAVNNVLRGKVNVTVPNTAEIYEGNALSGVDALMEGRYARVCSNDNGVFAVRVYDGAEQSYAGLLRSYDGEAVVFNTGTRTVTLAVDSRTMFKASGVTGTSEVYDEEAGYKSIIATVDPTGRMVALEFEGGSRVESLFLRAINTDGTYTVASHSGVERRVKPAEGCDVTLPEGYKTLGPSCVGMRMDCRVDNTTGELLTMEFDSTEYIQGGFVRTNVTTRSRTVTAENITTGSNTSYKMSEEVVVEIYNEKTGAMDTKRIGDLVAGQYVTLEFDANSVVVKIEAYPGSSTFVGKLVDIVYGKTITFVVESAEGEVREYTFESNNLPSLRRGNRIITADKLRVGDELTVAEKYSKIIQITAANAEADFTAVVEGLSSTTAGRTVTLRLDETGESVTYPLSVTAEILSGTNTFSADKLPGMKVAVTMVGDEIVTIEVKGASTQSGEYTGKVLFINTVERSILVELESGGRATISVPYSANVFRNGGTKPSNFGELVEDDIVTVYGEFAADGSFTASVVIVK